MITEQWGARWIRGLAGGVIAVAAVAAVAGCDAPPPPEPAPRPTAADRPTQPTQPTQPTAEPCPDGGVRLVEMDGNAAMGLRVADFRLVNCGAQPYVLEGYPQLSLRDDRNGPVEVAVEHGTAGITTGVPDIEEAPGQVTLAPGQAASFAIVWRNLVTDSSVPATTARSVEVEPRPGAPRLSLRLSAPVDLGNTGKLGLGPWRPVVR
ncbi:DUF4232 domain-containing protein [Streptomyces sp. NPDC090131]|uniref:DUF4232 domain-containing protein n=1 Tax=Streptomyces sp. NPDC090131 TaxID=3365954 RepID=UPI00380A6440